MEGILGDAIATMIQLSLHDKWGSHIRFWISIYFPGVFGAFFGDIKRKRVEDFYFYFVRWFRNEARFFPRQWGKEEG